MPDDARRFLMDRINYERAQSMPCSEEAFKLDRMRELLNRLGNPQQGMPIVHVAGTKGKGSTSAMLAAVLSAAGFHSGLFTSPHLDRVEERITLDARPCSAEDLTALLEQIRPVVEAMDRAAAEKKPPEYGPTYFEIITAAALLHFAQCRADAVVLEVGLGGRLDSTNVCTPVVSLITSISFDHTKQLGATLAAIAAEKAGIIKTGVTVVSGVTTDEPREENRRLARQNGCQLIEQGVDFDFVYRPPLHLEQADSPARIDFRYLQRDTENLEEKGEESIALEMRIASPRSCHPERSEGSAVNAEEILRYAQDDKNTAYDNLAIRLLGRHQAANAAMVLATVEQLRRIGWKIPEVAVRRGLAEVKWPARVEVVARRPAVVLDAAHNAASIGALVEALAESFSVERRWLIFATTQEKDLRGMLSQLLDAFDRVIFTRYQNNPRGVPPEQLQALAVELREAAAKETQKTGVRTADTTVVSTPTDAWNMVHQLAGPDDLICITGSFFIAAEMQRLIAAKPLG